MKVATFHRDLKNCVFHEAESGLRFDTTGISPEITKTNDT